MTGADDLHRAPPAAAPDADLPAIWKTRFEEDVRRDQHVEDVLLVRSWLAVALVAFLLLVRRLVV
jgi:hypothetical protein